MPNLEKKTFIAVDQDKEDVYVGIGISREEVDRAIPEDSGRTAAAEFKVYIALEPKTAVWGVKLMRLLDSGSVLGYNESGTGYLVGTLPELLEAGTEPLDIKGAYFLGRGSGWRVAGVEVPSEAEMEEAAKGSTKPPREEHFCLCGCGGITYSNFCMGHDSKLRGQIGRVLDGKEPASGLPKDAFKVLGTCNICEMPDVGHHRHKANPVREKVEKEPVGA